MLGIFPRTSANHLTLHAVGVFLCRVVLVVGVDVAGTVDARLGPSCRSPFGHVARHVVETEVVARIGADGRSNDVSVAAVVAIARFEVAVVAALVGVRNVGLPREGLVVVAGACCIFPFCLGGQTIGLNLNAAHTMTRHQKIGAPAAEGIGLFPTYTHHGIVVVDG